MPSEGFSNRNFEIAKIAYRATYWQMFG